MSLDRSRWNVQYMQRVLATDPIAYWMQDEKQGLVSYDMVTARSDGARNGAYTGPTLGQPGIGDGRTAPLYDGALDYADIYSVALNAAFNGQAVTIMAWIRVSAAGVWTDGNTRMVMRLRVDANNFMQIVKVVPNGTMNWQYVAGGVSKARTVATFAGRTEWIPVALTADRAADEVRAYADGIQAGATLVGLGVWAGNLDPVFTLMGASTQVPNSPWDGWLAHGIVWDRALSPAEMLFLGVL